MANTHMNRCWTSFVIRTVQIKTTVRYHHVIIRMAKIKTVPHVGKNVEQLDFQTLLVGMYNGTATLGNSLEVSSKAENKPIITSTHFIPKCLPQRNQSIRPYASIHSSFIYNSAQLEITQCLSTGERINKP